jgi:hypothetical protein
MSSEQYEISTLFDRFKCYEFGNEKASNYKHLFEGCLILLLILAIYLVKQSFKLSDQVNELKQEAENKDKSLNDLGYPVKEDASHAYIPSLIMPVVILAPADGLFIKLQNF